MITLPPPYKKAALATALSLTFLSLPAHSEILVVEDLTGETICPEVSHFENETEIQRFDGLSVNHLAPIANGQFTVFVSNSHLQINGDSAGLVYADTEKTSYQEGNHFFLIQSKGTLELNGNVDVSIEVAEDFEEIGANLLYAKGESKAYIGQEGSTTRMWDISSSPDLISSKSGSQVIFRSTNNQLVGTMDTMDRKDTTGQNGIPNSIVITFSGPEAYWFGDEKSYMNSDWQKTDPEGYADWLEKSGDRFDLTFENGAQWTYMGIQSSRNDQFTIPKRISSITLNGGIINLYDADVEAFWKNIGLWDLIQNEDFHMDVEGKHDYVQIGNLKGSGGIFRLDLNGYDKTQSDMIYIEAGEGTHYFEPYNLNLLESITPENTLTFALVAPGSTVQFKDKQNLLGETLYDYELEIAKKQVTTEDIESADNAYWDKTASIVSEEQKDQAIKIDLSEFDGGDNWFIRRVTLKESAAAVGMTGAGYASYDAAIEMDRRDRRLAEQVRGVGKSDNGLWVRVHHGKNGIENQYRWDRTGATIGFDRQVGDQNRLGAYFSYTEGDTEFLDVRGDGEMKRYELALFDTLTLGQNYLDFVARFGHISSDFSVGNVSYSTSGSFDQNYGALSAEYGYQLRDENGVFVEPQLQLQVTYVDGYSYQAQRGMRVEADNEVSVIARTGLRAGREFSTDTTAGSLYARADLYHQFTDGQNAVLSDNIGHRLDENWGDTDTWASIGLGTSWVWKNRLGLQVDVEKVTGGKTDDTWLMSGRINYLF